MKKVLILQGQGQETFAERLRTQVVSLSAKYGEAGLTPVVLNTIEEVIIALGEGKVHFVCIVGEYEINAIKALKRGYRDVGFIILSENLIKTEVVILPRGWLGATILERVLFVGQ